MEVKAPLCSLRQENADRHKETLTEAKEGRDKQERLSQGSRRHRRKKKISEEGVSVLKFD